MANREIRFRAWDKNAKVMVQDVSHIQLDHFEVMQYTGLKDKNGVEIYEGDIVRKPRDLHIGDVVVAHQGEFQDDAFIEWVDGSFRLNKIGSDSRNYYGVLNYSENTQPELLEVIGNIYENPDLLKGEPNE